MSNAEELIERLAPRLSIDREDIETDVLEHPQRLWEISRAAARAISDRDGAKEVSTRVKIAQMADLFEDDPKLSKTKAEDLASTTTVYKTARQRYVDLCGEVEELLALKEAFVARGYALHNFANLQTARMGSSDSVSTNHQSGTVKSYRRESGPRD